MTKQFADHGLCDYNLTLINDMPSAAFHSSVGFKEEAFYGKSLVSHLFCDISLSDSIQRYGERYVTCHCQQSDRAAFLQV